jgi:RNA-directed DNA polymerase
MVECCCSQQQAEQVSRRRGEGLEPRGLVFNEDKVRIVNLGQSRFEFPAFDLRRYRGWAPSGQAERSLGGSNSMAVMARLNRSSGMRSLQSVLVACEDLAALDDYV